MSDGKKHRAAVVGLGIGRRHVETLAQRGDVDLVALCDQDAALCEKTAGDYATQAFTDYAEMLEETAPTAVFLCTPPRLHAPMTEAAAAHGIHVFCEKPMAGTCGDCERMIAAADAAGVVLMIAQKKRFHPFYMLLKEKCPGEWGAVKWASIRFALGRVEKDWFWTEGDGGGPLVENCVHVFDLLRYLIGEVESVFAFGGNLFLPHRAPQIDSAAATLRFVSGAVASLGLGYGSEWSIAVEQCAFATERVVVDCDGPFDRPQNFHGRWREHPDQAVEFAFPPDADMTGFATEVDHFLCCVNDGVPTLASGRDCAESVRLCLAVKESIRSGAAVQMAEFHPA